MYEMFNHLFIYLVETITPAKKRWEEGQVILFGKNIKVANNEKFIMSFSCTIVKKIIFICQGVLSLTIIIFPSNEIRCCSSSFSPKELLFLWNI